jgi:hypothetical protein
MTENTNPDEVVEESTVESTSDERHEVHREIPRRGDGDEDVEESGSAEDDVEGATADEG